jgi:hypothetical protein
MKLLFTVTSLLISLASQAGVILVEGSYQNQNIYIKNAYRSSGVGFCAYEVRINGSVTTDEINSTSFEVDLSHYKLELGAPLSIEIRYNDDGCRPMVLNPTAVSPNPTFETLNISVEKGGLLEWVTINETAMLPFIIEQFKWNKWVKIGEVTGKGTPDKNTYSFITDTHAGNNKFRIKQKGHIDKTIHSPSVSYRSSKSEISYIYNRKTKGIEFAEETNFEVYNKFGDLVKKGYSNKINVQNLDNDSYYMNYGNTTCEFKKK